MSIKRMTAVWERSQHKGSALLLMLALADVADDLGVCWPGYAYLSKKIRMGRDSAIRLADFCVTSGELWRLTRSQQRSNMYVVTVGLTYEELETAGAKLLDNGVRPPTGSRILQPPPQVLEVVGKSYHLVGKSDHVAGSSYEVVVPRPVGGRTAILPDPSLPVITQEENISDLVPFDQWPDVLKRLKWQTAKQVFDTHLSTSKAYQRDGTVVVVPRGEWSVEWMNRDSFKALITNAVTAIAGCDVTVIVQAADPDPAAGREGEEE